MAVDTDTISTAKDTAQEWKDLGFLLLKVSICVLVFFIWLFFSESLIWTIVETIVIGAFVIWCGVAIWKAAKEYEAFAIGSFFGGVFALISALVLRFIHIPITGETFVCVAWFGLVFLSFQGTVFREAHKKEEEERLEKEKDTDRYLTKLEQVASAASRLYEARHLYVGTREGKRLIEALIELREERQRRHDEWLKGTTMGGGRPNDPWR